jgi:hypothetical protein
VRVKLFARELQRAGVAQHTLTLRCNRSSLRSSAGLRVGQGSGSPCPADAASPFSSAAATACASSSSVAARHS